MKTQPGKYRSLSESGRRLTVLAVVIGGHLGLLTLMLRPPIFYRNATAVARNNLQVLKLRFLPPVQPSSRHPALLPQRHIAPSAQSRKASPAGSPNPRAFPPAVNTAATPFEAPVASTPIPDRNEKTFTSDGGFQERLRHALHASAVRGVPGSSAPVAPGFPLADPMHQGIGAVMRTAQRAFGIENRHCIDVDAWRQLTLQELSERHISPSDVDNLDQKYACNKPPGLHF